ncbi:hypothetical protein HYC85_027925 [Camellia sinensis]|uniref:non-specific serine/threonine protein kinase n=1 Tax=Camellia sinensis TaxID=4442 RepID=A0A7J7FXR5_CAMSI|nr:hypothetical protein HYC85_027925 [Camellia sinensis]
MALKNQLRSVFSSCFKPENPKPDRKILVSKQYSFQRLSVSDLSNPVSPLSIEDLSNSVIGSNLHIFTLAELKMITHNFSSSNYLGEGGFGPVHKGFVDDKIRPGLEAQPVAVKLLDLDGTQGHREWLAEVIFLGQLRHPHLVKLIGYCCEDEHRLLVYEYMARGNLENQLFRRYSISLQWSTRLKIAIGAAKGLAFLHGEEKPVIYRDFKASNVLLDADYTAKLSDFGLAKDGPEGDETHVTTRHLTAMSDVYSFGVVLLELLTGRRVVDKKRPAKEQNLVDWAKPLLKDPQKLDRIMDPRLEGQYSKEGARKAACLAYQCLSHQAKARPTMSHAVKTLEPLMDLDDYPTESFVYIAPTEGDNKPSVVSEKKNENEEKEIGGCNQQQKDQRPRRRHRSFRSRAVYSDTALYKKFKNGLNSPN